MNVWTHDWLHAVLHLLQTIVNQLSVHGLHDTYNVTFLVVGIVCSTTDSDTHTFIFWRSHQHLCTIIFLNFLYLLENFVLFLIINAFDKASKSCSVECQVLWSRWLPFLWEKSLHHREIWFYAFLTTQNWIQQFQTGYFNC